VSKRYGRACALSGVDLVVSAGSVVGLIGPNGSGKTTAISIAAGLVRADAGTVSVVGSEPGGRSARAATALVPDEPAGFDDLRVDELPVLAHALWGVPPSAAARARVLADAFGLGALGSARLGDLSRGRRRQAFFVAAGSLAPRLLLVDEAAAAFDPETVVVLRETLRALAHGGCGVLVATQDINFAGSTCSCLVLLDRGTVVAAGTAGDLCAQAQAGSLEEAFLALSGTRLALGRLRGDLAAL
jgi:ABC-type multidrug transport system ATPase subunit